MTMLNWDKTKERLKQKISTLTDGNSLFAKEKKEEIIIRLEGKLGLTREAINKIISQL